MRIAILGAGARGSDWVARGLLMGWDVAVFDPDAGAEARLAAARSRAEAALPALYDVALPQCGALQVCGGIAQAVAGADWVLDATPDREELKRTLFRTAQADMAPGAGLISTARGLDLDALRRCATAPDSIYHVQAGDPAFLLPLAAVFPDAVDARLAGFLDAMGLMPGDAEALADQAALLRASGLGDGAAVSVLRALKARGAGIGEALRRHEARLAPQGPRDFGQPPETLRRQVPPDWVDYNGHMNEARYLTAFSEATDRLLLWAGMDAACVAEGHSVFTVETHIQHLGEVHIGQMISVTTRVLEGAGKRLHLWHEMRDGPDLAATAEQMLLHMDLNTRRVALPRADVGAYFTQMAEAQSGASKPDGIGRFVGAPRS